MNEKPTIPEVLPLIQSFYQKPENRVGGNLHILLDDFNIDDDSVRFCIESCQEANDKDGLEIAQLLLKMSKTQRSKLAKLAG